MKRSQWLLFGAGMVLIVALFFVLLFQPAREELDQVEQDIVAEQDRQVQLQQQIARLVAVRDEAPEEQARLAAAQAVVPVGPALPEALRSLQLAADEAGIVLESVTTARPAPIGAADPQLSAVALNLQVTGAYFPVVDFLRRIEDPTITARGISWNTISVNRGEYPELQVSLGGQLFAVIVEPAPPVTEEAPDADADATDDGDGANESELETEDVS